MPVLLDNLGEKSQKKYSGYGGRNIWHLGKQARKRSW